VKEILKGNHLYRRNDLERSCTSGEVFAIESGRRGFTGFGSRKRGLAEVSNTLMKYEREIYCELRSYEDGIPNVKILRS